MGFSNNMTNLLNKLEVNRLGVKMLNLPPELSKDKWATDVIIPDTLTTFSRYFPNQIEYQVNQSHPRKDGWYYIDESFIEGVEVLGVRDLDWATLSQDSLFYQDQMGYGMVDALAQSSGFSFEDVAMVQMKADFTSLFNNRLYIDFQAPNKFAVKGNANLDYGKGLKNFKVLLLIKHADTLTTISPTKMEIFEKLATCDVANYLYNNLKYFDGLQTVYAAIDLKMDDLKTKADQREDVIEEIKNSYVSAANDYAPMIMCI
jgi:hypothetical protein